MKLTPAQRLASACAYCSQNGTSCLSHTCIDCAGYVPGDFAHECAVRPGPADSAPPDPATSLNSTVHQRPIEGRPNHEPERELAEFIIAQLRPDFIKHLGHFKV